MIEITAQYLASQGLSNTFPQRFWEKVIKTDGCWIWTGSISKGYGYGWIGKGAKKARLIKAHRASWILHNGPIPDGKRILHRCDNPLCVRPDHLWLGTQKENIRDAVEKGRVAIGEMNNSAKLTPEQVREIKRRYSLGNVGKTALGRHFGVSRGCIYAIVNHINWKHVT